jgi:hypothetical protein
MLKFSKEMCINSQNESPEIENNDDLVYNISLCNSSVNSEDSFNYEEIKMIENDHDLVFILED